MTDATDATAPFGADGTARRDNGTFRSLRTANARRFFAGLLVSNVGSWMQLTATSFLLYDLTGSATSLGINTAMQFVPMLVLGAWAGALSDRVDRLRLTIAAQSALAAQALALGVVVVVGWATVPVIYALSAVLGIVGAIDNPARRSLVTELVPPQHIVNAVALNTAVMTGSRVIGPALAAALVGPLGAGWLFVANGVSYSAMLVGLVRIRRTDMFTHPPRPAGGKPVREALVFLRDRQPMFAMFTVFALVSTFAFNYSVSLPKLADTRWGSPEAFGWVLAITSLGSMLGALALGRRSRVTYRFIAGGVMVLGATNIGLSWAPSMWVAFAWALPLGASGAMLISGSNAVIQHETPPEMRGRMMALAAVAFLGSAPIGGPITGWIADVVSPEWSMAYGGFIALVSGAWLWRRTERGA